MTPEQQRIAIAEACGIETWQGDCPDKSLTKAGKLLPDYFNDLNAMHEAEKTLTNQQRKLYGETLLQQHDYWNSELKIHGHAVYELVHTTAEQRAKAFLRTLNLWTA